MSGLMFPLRVRKKPVEVEAFPWTGFNTDSALHFVGKDGYYTTLVNGVSVEYIAIQTLEGLVYASVGDWIVKGVKGEFYPVRADIFDLTYEPVTAFTGDGAQAVAPENGSPAGVEGTDTE